MERLADSNFIEQLSGKLMNFLKIKKSDDRIHYLKCKLGLELLLINTSKIFVIYLIAELMSVFLQTMVFHFAFLYVRAYAQGAHARSSLKCTAISALLFVGIPCIGSHGCLVSERELFLLYVVGVILILFYAPSATPKNPITNSRKRRVLRIRALILQIPVAIVFALPLDLQMMNLIILGIATACLLLLPKAHEML